MTELLPNTRPPVEQGSELEVLTSMLDRYRAAVVAKVDGFTDDQARSHPVPASALTIAGVVKHLAATERWWFPIDFAGLDVEPLYPDGDPDGGFSLEEDDTLEGLVTRYVEECQRSRAAITGRHAGEIARSDGMDFMLRYALVHMIEETARHCGHLDLLAESLDGRRGG